MIRAFLTAVAATLLLGAAKVPTVDYRLGVEPHAGAPATLAVEMTLRGDADGETQLMLPNRFNAATDAWRYVSDLQIAGAAVEAPDAARRVLRHKPGAKITVRYRVQTAYDQDPAGPDGQPGRGPILRPDWLAVLGEFAFAWPDGREGEPATFRWRKLPKGWQAVSDLEHARQGRPMTVLDVEHSIVMAGSKLAVVERPIPGGTLRVASLPGGPAAERVTNDVTQIVAAQRTFWNDLNEPYLVAVVPLTTEPGRRSISGMGRDDAFVLFATPGSEDRLRWTMSHEHIHTWIPRRTGSQPSGDAQKASVWLSEGFTEFFSNRTLLRAGLAPPEDVVGRMSDALKAYDANPLKTAPNSRIVADFWKDRAAKDLPYQRGQLLALKWDEEIRKKTGGKADLDDVILRMRDHYRQFPEGQGPDIVTGLVSAAWVVAKMDLRPDIARYADGGAAITFPEIMFDGCLDARVTVSPGFDSGFDHAASAAAKVAKGVRRGGPAWNSGLRDGMRIDALDFKPGDMTREIVMTVRPAAGRAKAKTIRYWPYGDNDVEARSFQLAMGLTGEQTAACGRKLGGL